MDDLSASVSAVGSNRLILKNETSGVTDVIINDIFLRVLNIE